jgi:hypothetical protein
MAALWRTPHGDARPRRPAASSRRRARLGLEQLGERVLPSGVVGPDRIIDLNRPVGVAGQVQAVFADNDPVGGAGQTLPGARAPHAVVVYEDEKVRVTVAGTPAVPSRFALDVQETQGRPLSVTLEEFARGGTARVRVSDNLHILLLLGRGDGPLLVEVGNSFAHLEEAVMTAHFGPADETLVFDIAFLHKEHGGEGNADHAEGWGRFPNFSAVRLTLEARRHPAPAPGAEADEAGDPAAGGEGALALPEGKPDGPSSTANAARASLDDFVQPGPAEPAAGTAEVDVGADGREAALRLTLDWNLPAAQVDLVPLEPKNLAVVATFLAGQAGNDGGPGADPGHAGEQALNHYVIGLGPVTIGDRGDPPRGVDGSQGDAVGRQANPEPAPTDGGPAAPESPPAPAGAHLPGQGPARAVAAAAPQEGAIPEADCAWPDLLDGLLPPEDGAGVAPAAALLGTGALLAWRGPDRPASRRGSPAQEKVGGGEIPEGQGPRAGGPCKQVG